MFTRRQFLQGAAATAAAPMILSRAVGAVAASERLAIGIPGWAMRGASVRVLRLDP